LGVAVILCCLFRCFIKVLSLFLRYTKQSVTSSSVNLISCMPFFYPNVSVPAGAHGSSDFAHVRYYDIRRVAKGNISDTSSWKTLMAMPKVSQKPDKYISNDPYSQLDLAAIAFKTISSPSPSPTPSSCSTPGSERSASHSEVNKKLTSFKPHISIDLTAAQRSSPCGGRGVDVHPVIENTPADRLAKSITEAMQGMKDSFMHHIVSACSAYPEVITNFIDTSTICASSLPKKFAVLVWLLNPDNVEFFIPSVDSKQPNQHQHKQDSPPLHIR
jgi:hypothetical protein